MYVRKGKNYQEQIVPISKTNSKYLVDYIYDHRPELTKRGKKDALIVAPTRATRMQPQSWLYDLIS